MKYAQTQTAPPTETGAVAAVSGSIKVVSKPFTFRTDKRVELYNLTGLVKALVQELGVRQGFLILSSLHTTTALFINEFQAALLDDIKTFLERVISRTDDYKHNSPLYSDCERRNADAHLRSMLLGHSITLAIADSEPVMGGWQNIIFAELDGPRERQLVAQVIGI